MNRLPSRRFTYTQQNNLRATSFIFPLIITIMRPSSFKIILWAKLEVAALFQSAQHVRNMSSYKSVNGTNIARPKDSKKNGFQKKQKKKKQKKKKNDFLPQNEVFFTIAEKILCLMKTIPCQTHNHANSNFLQVKGTQLWPEKRPTLWEAKNASKVPHRQRIICRGYL